MKKIFLLMFACMIISSKAIAVEPAQTHQNLDTKQANIQELRKAREQEFEKKLGLTEEQKNKAHEMRNQSFEKMKPIIAQIKDKRKEAEMIKLSRMAVQMQEEKLAEINEEIKELHKQLHEIRKANMQDFESILTKDQKKILKNMKKEGHKKYKAAHPKHK